MLTKHERNQQFLERFEVEPTTGSYLMTSHGCFQRHNRPRSEQEMTRQESRIRNFETGCKEAWADGKLTEMVSILQRKGVPLVEPTLEMYVQNNLDTLIEQEDITPRDVTCIIEILIRRS